MFFIHILISIIILIIPVFVGCFFHTNKIVESYLYGQVFSWAIFQVIAVPMILIRTPFIVLVVSYMLILIVFSILGVKNIPEILKNIKLSEINVPLIIAIVIIIGQMLVYFLGMHLDEDDARWIAEANDAITKNSMYLYNPATGAYAGEFVGEVKKDVFSPWSMYIAFFSKITGINASIVSHTVLAPILLALSYMVYYEMSKELFKGKNESGIFVLSVAVINLFWGGNRHTQAVTSLIRIWQGKAVVAAVMIPFLFLVFLKVQEDEKKEKWLWIMVAGCASCLLSGMGIAISCLMIGVLGLYAILFKRWRSIPYYLLSMVPSLVFGMGYYFLR